MLDIGIFAPYGADLDRNIAFCQDTDVHHIALSSGAIVPEGSDGVPPVATMKDRVETYAGGGVQLTALTPPRISPAAFTDAEVRKEALDFMQRLVEGMGQAGIPLVHLYLSVDPIAGDPDRRARLWEGLLAFYGGLIPVAERAGVRISTHHYHHPDRLLWNYETMSTLLSEVQSPSNGVTFCQGKSHLAGDDLVDNILGYGDRIFMFHIRDVVTRVSGKTPLELERRLAELGYLEVAFGAGEVDMVGSFRALKQIDYQGQIYPEHFPSIAGDSAAGLAWTIGYIRAMDQALEA